MSIKTPNQINININDFVRVTLTELGIQHLRKCASMKEGCDLLPEDVPAPGEFLEAPLWQIMACFGELMFNGAQLVFSDNVVSLPYNHKGRQVVVNVNDNATHEEVADLYALVTEKTSSPGLAVVSVDLVVPNLPYKRAYHRHASDSQDSILTFKTEAPLRNAPEAVQAMTKILAEDDGGIEDWVEELPPRFGGTKNCPDTVEFDGVSVPKHIYSWDMRTDPPDDITDAEWSSHLEKMSHLVNPDKAKSLIQTILVNVGNDKLTDAQFRMFVRNSLPNTFESTK